MNAAIDMAQFIAPKSDQLNADDLIAGPMTIRITRVSANPDSGEQPISISFERDQGKPYKPCKSMRRVMVAVWGADASKYVGRAMTLYRDPKVQFGGMAVGGIRISHMSHMEREQTLALTATRAKRTPFVVKPLRDQPSGAGNPSAGDTAASAPSADRPSQTDAGSGAASEEPNQFELEDALRAAENEQQLREVWLDERWVKARKVWSPAVVAAVTKAKDDRKAELTKQADDLDY